jgi:hypothetical protein
VTSPEFSRAALARLQMDVLQRVITLEYATRRANNPACTVQYYQIIHQLVEATAAASVLVQHQIETVRAADLD